MQNMLAEVYSVEDIIFLRLLCCIYTTPLQKGCSHLKTPLTGNMKMQSSCLFFIISLSLIAVILQAPESHAMRLPLAQQSNHHSNHHSLNDQQIRMQQRKAIASLRVKRQARETEYE